MISWSSAECSTGLSIKPDQVSSGSACQKKRPKAALAPARDWNAVHFIEIRDQWKMLHRWWRWCPRKACDALATAPGERPINLSRPSSALENLTFQGKNAGLAHHYSCCQLSRDGCHSQRECHEGFRPNRKMWHDHKRQEQQRSITACDKGNTDTKAPTQFLADLTHEVNSIGAMTLPWPTVHSRG